MDSRWLTMQCGLELHANCSGVRRGGEPCDCPCHAVTVTPSHSTP